MNSLMVRFVGVALLLAAAFTSAGCGKSRGKISGRVLLEDKPLAMGSVIFEDVDRQPHMSKIGPDGSYEVTDVPFGVVKITVLCPDPGRRPQMKMERKMSPELKESFTKKGVSEGFRPPEGDPEKWFPIPDEYTNIGNAKIELTISQPVTKFDVVMKGPPPE